MCAAPMVAVALPRARARPRAPPRFLLRVAYLVVTALGLEPVAVNGAIPEGFILYQGLCDACSVGVLLAVALCRGASRNVEVRGRRVVTSTTSANALFRSALSWFSSCSSCCSFTCSAFCRISEQMG